MAMTLRTDPELEQALNELAARHSRSRQEIVRLAVLEQYRREIHRERVAASANRLIEKWGDVLDRLGDS